MISLAEAVRLVMDEARVLGTVEVDLPRAFGRVLAEEVDSDRDMPPTDRSAMDGFAVRAADAAEPGATLEVAGELRAGRPVGATRVGPGQAVKIMTGAIVPPGADAVVMVETTEPAGPGRVRILGRVERGQHVRRRGEDVRAGESVLRRGCPIHAPEMAALASVGRARVTVFRPPAVSVLSTGDEVVGAGAAVEDHQVRNSNAVTLLHQLRDLGLEGRDLGIAPDAREDLERSIREGLSADVLLVTGGVSAGEYDLVGEVLAGAGMKLVFHRVAVRPGKPILVGRAGGCLVVGLPGNPVSTFTGFAVFVAPALRRMMGHSRWDNLRVDAVLAERLKRKPGRTTFHLARVAIEGGGFVAMPVRTSGSADAVSMSRANAFVLTDPGAHALEAGTKVPAILWRDFHLR